MNHAEIHRDTAVARGALLRSVSAAKIFSQHYGVGVIMQHRKGQFREALVVLNTAVIAAHTIRPGLT